MLALAAACVVSLGGPTATPRHYWRWAGSSCPPAWQVLVTSCGGVLQQRLTLNCLHHELCICAANSTPTFKTLSWAYDSLMALPMH